MAVIRKILKLSALGLFRKIQTTVKDQFLMGNIQLVQRQALIAKVFLSCLGLCMLSFRRKHSDILDLISHSYLKMFYRTLKRSTFQKTESTRLLLAPSQRWQICCFFSPKSLVPVFKISHFLPTIWLLTFFFFVDACTRVIADQSILPVIQDVYKCMYHLFILIILSFRTSLFIHFRQQERFVTSYRSCRLRASNSGGKNCFVFYLPYSFIQLLLPSIKMLRRGLDIYSRSGVPLSSWGIQCFCFLYTQSSYREQVQYSRLTRHTNQCQCLQYIRVLEWEVPIVSNYSLLNFTCL